MSFDVERRRVLSGLALLLGAGLVVEQAQCASRRAPMAPNRATVARALRPQVLEVATGAVNVAILREQLGKAVAVAVGAEGPKAAFERLFRPSDVVGIKVNTLGGRGISSRPEVAALLCEWLEQAGVRPNNIIVWDRSDRELEAAGYVCNRGSVGVRCQGTNDDYDWTVREWGDGASCFSRLLASELTALINLGVVKDHELSGISAGMKNLYGTIHNPNKYHDNGCSPYLAQLGAFPLIRNILRLTVLDGLLAQCHGGPARNPRWAWAWGGVLVSTDPVAIDAVAYRVVEERRHEVGLQSLREEGRAPRWLDEAEKLGLGEAQLEKIQVVDT